MRKLLAIALSFVLIGSSAVHATDYVCQLTLAPAALDPTFGSNGYVGIYTSQAPACSGGTSEYFICSKGATNHSCGVNAQYSEAALIAVYETLRSAQSAQHPVVPYWNACINAGGNCTGGILLYPDI